MKQNIGKRNLTRQGQQIRKIEKRLDTLYGACAVLFVSSLIFVYIDKYMEAALPLMIAACILTLWAGVEEGRLERRKNRHPRFQ